MAPSGLTPPELPQTIGRYRILGPLAPERHDDVFKGFDPMIERHLVVKIFPLGTLDRTAADVIRQTFFGEMQRTGMLTHTGITTLFDAGELPGGGGLFMASEFVDGTSLDEHLDAVLALPLAERVSLVVQLADALEYAREQGVPHLHLRPSNILIAPDFTAKIRGFGIAHVLDVLGTPATDAASSAPYAAPERIAGEHGDTRSDVFSLARIADRLLGDAAESAGAGFTDTLNKALAPSAADRFVNVGAFKYALLLSLGLDEVEVRTAWDSTREAGNVRAADRGGPGLPHSAVNGDLTAMLLETPTQLTPSGVGDEMTMLEAGDETMGPAPGKPA